MPMFPLGTVLFPHALLPLHVFEPRYRLMTERVLRGDGEFGVVLIERGSEVGGGDTRFDVGTVARVVRAQELPDGGYALATVGIRRIRVDALASRRSVPAGRGRRPRRSGRRVGRADAVGAPVRARALNALGDVCGLYRRLEVRGPRAPGDRRRAGAGVVRDGGARADRSARRAAVLETRDRERSARRCSPSCSTSTRTCCAPATRWSSTRRRGYAPRA